MKGFDAMLTKINEFDSHSLIHIHTIGQSVLDKPIYELVVGSGPKKIHWNGGFHGNEWMTSMLLMDTITSMIASFDYGSSQQGLDWRKLFDKVTLSVVPMVNPDGVDLSLFGSNAADKYNGVVEELNKGHKTFSSWKANIRGVDLNKQFPAGWDVEQHRKPKKPTFRDHPGQAPLTEPESQAMYQLLSTHEFDRVLCFHSQGEVIYYGYNGREPNTSDHVVAQFARVSGYEPIRTFDSHAGMKDWYIDQYQKEGYTIEVGKGINPLPMSQYQYNLHRVKQIGLQSLLL